MRQIFNTFQVPKRDGSLATMVVRMEVVKPSNESQTQPDNASQGTIKARVVRLRFEAADEENEAPITIRNDLPIFNKVSSFFENGYFTLEGSAKFLADDRNSACVRRRINENPINVAELLQLPYSVEHVIPEYLLSWAKEDFGLKDGDQVSLHLNASAIQMNFWINKSVSDLKDAKVLVLAHNATNKAEWEAAGHKVEVGLDPKLLHWDITQACCSITI